MDDVAGGAAALASAFFFTLGAMIFGRLGARVSPWGLNLGKGVLALALTGMLLAVKGAAAVAGTDFALLGVSGIVGILIGDTAYFRALTLLGPRQTLLMDTLGPGLAALGAWMLLNEGLLPRQWLGIAVTMGGVWWVMLQRSEGSKALAVAGVVAALVSVGAHLAGVLLSKVALREVPALEATVVRQAWAVAGLFAWGMASGALRDWVTPLRDPRVLRTLAAAAFLGTFLGIYLSMLALKLASTGVATTLSATGPLFVLPLSAVFAGERITARASLGALLAVAGIALLMWPG